MCKSWWCMWWFWMLWCVRMMLLASERPQEWIANIKAPWNLMQISIWLSLFCQKFGTSYVYSVRQNLSLLVWQCCTYIWECIRLTKLDRILKICERKIWFCNLDFLFLNLAKTYFFPSNQPLHKILTWSSDSRPMIWS